MSTNHCKECGTDYEASLKECPTCGCPARYAEEIKDSAQQAVTQTVDEQDFNEHYEYSPFSEGSRFTRTPWPLNKYPRRAFAEKHPFFGWLFDPWHLTCRDASKQEQYDTINNIFYLFNLFFKANFYAACWAFLRIWWSVVFVVAVILGICLFMCIFQGSSAFYDAPYYIFMFSPLITLYLAIAYFVHYCCGMGAALHRYWPSFHKTWRRVNKRYWKAMKK